ncbi:YrhA family protein [Escherichia coli]|uniref:YrhA family protein n=1 Tax=Escherichia coli TaxID=562 RepID=UPI002078F359|nr:YrhA family protein [Escherichia coli]
MIRCVCGKKIGPDPRNFNQRVSLGRNDLLIRTFPNCLEKLCNEVSILFKNQPDYLTFLRAMDGFEVNGLRLFSLSIPEPSVKNLFAVNEFYRNNDDFINPDLQERLVIGDDSISIFTYDIKSNFFEIRDNIGTENIFSSFSDFSSFLNEIMDSCS